MEANSPEICAICKKSMKDPRILPCYHSFCLKCLESSNKSSVKRPKCPTCQIGFEIPTGGLKELKKNLFVEQLKSYKESGACEVCKDNPALNFCVECSCNLCSTCLDHHEKLPISRNHQLQTIKTNQSIKGKSIVKKYQTCEEHSEVMNLFCKDCKVVLCGLCFTSKHKNHEMKHASEFYDSAKNKLEGNLKKKKDVIKNIINQHENNKKEITLCEEKSCKVKQEIQKRGEEIKEFIHSIVLNLQKQVDELLNKQKSKLEKIIRKLEVLEKNLSEDIRKLEEQLDGLKYENVKMNVKISSQIKEELVEIPTFFKDFHISLTPQKNYEMTLKEIMGSILKVPQLDVSKKVKLNFPYSTFATNGTDLFFWSSKELEVDVYSYDGMIFKSRFKLNLQSMEVFDLLLINNTLYIACTVCKAENLLQVYGIYTILMPFGIFNAKLIFKFQYEEDVLNMSKSYSENILLTLKDRLLEISENVLKKIDFPVSNDITDAVQINDHQFWLCYNDGVFVFDNKGKKLHEYYPNMYCIHCINPYHLSKDNFGNIYAMTKGSDILAFDYNFHILSVHCIPDQKYAIKMCYVETKNELFILMNDSQLLVMDL